MEGQLYCAVLYKEFSFSGFCYFVILDPIPVDTEGRLLVGFMEKDFLTCGVVV